MGRPRGFDRDEAVERAMDTFWARGYNATTPEGLAQRLQVGKGSVYHAFGSKRRLFDLALRRYLDTRARSVEVTLSEPGPAKERLRDALGILVQIDFERPDRRGCLATNSAVEFGGADDDVAALVLDLFGRTEAAFCALIERGQRDGDIRAELRATEVASTLLATVVGMHVLARVDTEPARLLRVVDAAVDLL